MGLGICVVGAGPRGTSVLERLCANASGTRQRIVVDVVDPAPAGPGAVWRPDQSPELLMNTVTSQVSLFTDESVPCAGPVVPGPSLYEWARMLRAGEIDREIDGEIGEAYPEQCHAEAARLGPDDYPTRGFYGHYLEWVVARLVATAPENLTIRTHRAEAVALDDAADGSQTVTLSDGHTLTGLDQVVLALGHGPLLASDTERDHADFAIRHGLRYVGPASPADADLDTFAPGEAVLIRGLGLCFFDYLALLTTGRGGRFARGPVGLYYHPSGREPLLYAGSRRGVPHHARGENEKGPHGRHLPRFLTEPIIAELRTLAREKSPPRFRDRVWPLVDREVRTVYYETMIRGLAGPDAADEFVKRSLSGEPMAELLEPFDIAPEQHWDWALIERPYAGRDFVDAAAFRTWLVGHLRDDVAHARLGNVNGPRKAALDVLRDLRNEVRLVVDHSGISGDSYREELERWYNPLNTFLSIGPPASRVEEMVALIEAGTLRMIGPGLRVTTSARDGRFVADSALVPHPPVAVRGLVEARLPETDLRRTSNPLLRHLRDTGQARPYRIDGYESGGLAVTERPYRVVDRAGHAHPARFAFGVPTEGVHWVTAAGIRPGVGSVTLEDSDAIARAMLGLESNRGAA